MRIATDKFSDDDGLQIDKFNMTDDIWKSIFTKSGITLPLGLYPVKGEGSKTKFGHSKTLTNFIIWL